MLQVDLHNVEVYFQSLSLVDERHLPYYVRRLQRFLVGPGGDGCLTWEGAQRAFVEPLERGSVPEWQVRQAVRAVELYQKPCRRFREEQAGVLAGETAAADRSGEPASLALSKRPQAPRVEARRVTHSRAAIGCVNRSG